MSTLYEVMLNGAEDNVDQAAVIVRLAATLEISEGSASAFLKSAPIVIKKRLSEDQSKAYIDDLAEIGVKASYRAMRIQPSNASVNNATHATDPQAPPNPLKLDSSIIKNLKTWLMLGASAITNPVAVSRSEYWKIILKYVLWLVGLAFAAIALTEIAVALGIVSWKSKAEDFLSVAYSLSVIALSVGYLTPAFCGRLKDIDFRIPPDVIRIFGLFFFIFILFPAKGPTLLVGAIATIALVLAGLPETAKRQA